MDALAQIEEAAYRYEAAETWLDRMELLRTAGLAVPEIGPDESPRDKAMHVMRYQMEQFGDGLRRLLSPSHPKTYANSTERAEAEHASDRLKRIVGWLADNGTVGGRLPLTPSPNRTDPVIPIKTKSGASGRDTRTA